METTEFSTPGPEEHRPTSIRRGRVPPNDSRRRWLPLVVALIAPVVLVSGVTAASWGSQDASRTDTGNAHVEHAATPDSSTGAPITPGKARVLDTLSAADNLAEAGEPSVFVPIAAFRMYDSRNGDGKWFAGDDFPLDALTDQFAFEQQIPDDATAVAFNIAAVGTEGNGYVQVYGPGTDPFSTSTVNWRESGLAIANSGSSALGTVDGFPGFMGVAVGGPLGRTHIIIDITGYYLAVS